jgi:peptidoglycan/LPS O-acetylase OafA/YrhL
VADTVTATVLAPALLQGWWPAAAAIWNLPSWSLSAEVFFYALFPWLLPRIAALRPCNAAALLTGTILSAAVLRLALDYLLPATGLPAAECVRLAEYLPLLHVPVFCCGIWLGVQQRRNELRLRYANTVAIAAVLLLVLLFAQELPGGLPLSPVTVPLCAVLIAALAGTTGWLQRLLSARWLQLGGEASYALYILHYPLFYLLLPVVKRLGWHDPRSSTVFFLLYVAVSLAVSIAVYRWWEVPSQRWLRRRLTARATAVVPAVADAVPATTAPVRVAASGPWLADGVPVRGRRGRA